MIWKILTTLTGFFERRAEKIVQAQYAEFLSAQLRLETLKSAGASNDEIRSAESHMNDIACGICKGLSAQWPARIQRANKTPMQIPHGAKIWNTSGHQQYTRDLPPAPLSYSYNLLTMTTII